MLDDIVIKYIKHIKDIKHIMSFKHSKGQLSELLKIRKFIIFKINHPFWLFEYDKLYNYNHNNRGKQENQREKTLPNKIFLQEVSCAIKPN